MFSKRRGDWITRRIYADKSISFRDGLMLDIIKRRNDSTIVIGTTSMELEMPDLPENIGSAYVDKPDKPAAIAGLRTRFRFVMHSKVLQMFVS